MTKSDYYKLGGLAAVALLLILWMRHRAIQVANSPAGAVVETIDQGAANPFTAPYYWNTPGVADTPVVLNSAASPLNTINITLNPNIAQFLSQAYIPMFGFVGVAAIGGA